MSIKYSLFFVLLLFILVGFGYLVTFNSLDPDFGWHLRTGELILERGVPRTDWYSFTMPDFPWIAHSWLTDILFYKVYSSWGFQALLLILLTLSAFSFVILIRQEHFSFYLLPSILGFLAILGFLGVRPQIITIFFAAILWLSLNRFLEGGKLAAQLIFLVPALFLVWVNLHGGFFAGLIILSLLLISEIFKKTGLFKKLMSLPVFVGQHYLEQPAKRISTLFFVSVLSFVATLFNPYGLRIYEEIFFRTSGDNFLRFHIAEWLPLLFSSPSSFTILYLSLFLGLLIPLRRKVEFNQLIVAVAFLILALLNQRHFFIFVVLTVPIFAQLILHFKQQVIPERVKILFSGFVKWAAVLVIVVIFSPGFYRFVKPAFLADKASYYPEKALPFLKTLPLSDNLFNEYGWGGYLIWNLPERKLFIDGRMPSWRKDPEGRPAASYGAGGQFVFDDYVKITEAEQGFEELLDKYEIKIALLRNEKAEEAENKLANFLKRRELLLKVLGIEQRPNLARELISMGWQVIYQDETAVILRR